MTACSARASSGPIKDYECLCGKYKRMKYKGIVCEKCGVEVTVSKVRRERMGHIELAAPVAHIWFLKSLPSRIGMLLDMQLKNLERVLYFEQYVVIEPGLTPMKKFDLLTEDELLTAQDEYGEDGFVAGIGAEAIRRLLEEMDLEGEMDTLREELRTTKSELKPKKIIKRMKVVESFIELGNKPEWMIMTVVPVIPPELRPLVPLDGGRFATSDLNDLYRRVINRNNRLKRLIELRAPDIIVRNEKRMLQEAVDALFDNGRRGRTITGANKRPLKSLSDMLKGKQGRFRQNLLGKRVDYSGRSVIVTGPELKLHQCGLPKKMALELFKPFIYSRLDAKGLSMTLKQAKKWVEKERKEVWDILDEVIREHPVLLNRAPTLHRLGIQAFEPVLIEGKAIQLHPLVCSAFNADFDGDQMAVHVPLSLEAQLEARVLMMSTNNILSPRQRQADHRAVAGHGAGAVLPVDGIQWRTRRGHGLCQHGRSPPGAARQGGDAALQDHAPASKPPTKPATWCCAVSKPRRAACCSAKRCRSRRRCPTKPSTAFSPRRKSATSSTPSIATPARRRRCCSPMRSCRWASATPSRPAFRSARTTWSSPHAKEKLVGDTKALVKDFEQQYQDGLITQGEKYNKVVDAWAKCGDSVANEMMKEISAKKVDANGRDMQINSVYMMAHSGARGSQAQMKQLAGMRGLMAKPSGEIIETPIISNFKEGLTVLEYFNSTHGARKGLADTALKTANSGYLTRRLVDVSQDCVVIEQDCGTERGMVMKAIVEGGNTIVSLGERILGRTVLQDIVDAKTGEVLAPAGYPAQRSRCRAHRKGRRAGSEDPLAAAVRNQAAASARTCYGRDLARGTPVNIGEAVGVIAAQSIGEPGTQLTMRTFHIGGAAQVSEQSTLDSPVDGTIEFRALSTIADSRGRNISMARNGELVLRDAEGRERSIHRIPYGATVMKLEGAMVSKGDRLAEWDPYTLPVITEKSGKVKYQDLIEGVSMSENVDEATGITQKVVQDWRAINKKDDLRPRITLLDEGSGETARYLLAVDAILSVNDGQEVFAGDVVARIPKEAAKTRDITGGLPRVAELFEARIPKDNAIIARINGRVEFGKDYKTKRRISIRPEDGGELAEYLVPKGKHVSVQEGDYVRRGDYLIDGNPNPHDILEVLGIEPLAEYLCTEVQEVYRLQGVRINDKHIETIVRQMLQKVEITKSGDTTLLVGEQVDREEMDADNAKLGKNGVPGRRQAGAARHHQGVACRPRASFRPLRSRKRRASLPKPRSRARSTRCRA